MPSTDLESTAGMHPRAICRYRPSPGKKDAVKPCTTAADGIYGGSRGLQAPEKQPKASGL
jgi:hypothetical protein